MNLKAHQSSPYARCIRKTWGSRRSSHKLIIHLAKRPKVTKKKTSLQMSTNAARSGAGRADSRSAKAKEKQERANLLWITKKSKTEQTELEWTVDKSGRLCFFEEKADGKAYRVVGKIGQITSTEKERSGKLAGMGVVYVKVKGKSVALDPKRLQFKKQHSLAALADTAENAIEYGPIGVGGIFCHLIHILKIIFYRIENDFLRVENAEFFCNRILPCFNKSTSLECFASCLHREKY